MNRRFEISGGDDLSYGARFGPAVVEEVGVIRKRKGIGPFILVRLLQPIEFNGEVLEFMTLTPRTVGDTLDTIRQKKCPIVFYRVWPGLLDEAKEGVNPSNSSVIAVGMSVPAKS